MYELRLTVEEEQVKGFLREGFKEFVGREGCFENYVAYAVLARTKAEDVYNLYLNFSEHMQGLMVITNQFITSAEDVVKSSSIKDMSFAIDLHWLSLEALLNLYDLNRGLRVKDIEPKKELLDEQIPLITECLRRQVLVANYLFDPKKRKTKFKDRISQEFEVFDRYAETFVFKS